MYRAYKRFHFLYLVIDAVLLGLVFYGYYLWRYNPGLWLNALSGFRIEKLYLPFIEEYTSIFIIWCAISLLCLNNFRLFSTDRQTGILKESWLVIKALSIAALPAAGAVFMLKLKMYSRLAFAGTLITSAVLLCLWRAGKRIYIRHRLAKGLGRIRVLILGAGRIGQTVAAEIKKRPYLGFEIAGFLSEERAEGERVCGYRVLGGYDMLEQVLRAEYVDEVFIAVFPERQVQERAVLLGRELGIGIKIVPELYEHIYGRLRTYSMGYIHFLEYAGRRIHGTELALKRIADIAGAFLLLAVFSPVFAALSILVKMDSKGPVLYVSKRVGRKKRVFMFYKFRSMICGAERLKNRLAPYNEVSGPVFKMKNDPRMTRIGRFIRRWSLDELPQLWNVLKGDMSLVGPRPPTPDEVEKYDLWQMRRLEVRPGITCMWQVRGRSDLSFYKWVKWDLWYIDNWSFWLDARILLWTIPAVLKGKGVY